MAGMVKYKGYCGSVEYSEGDDILHGRVLGISDVVSYEGRSIDELKKDFRIKERLPGIS
jgi:predicted HicB family RNase H-like nuclease